MLREYALLADGERGVLVGPRGDVSWMCFPRWHDPGLFSALIGGRGVYAVTPSERHVWGGYYESGTLIWHSRWVTTNAIIECREALVYPGDPNRVTLLRRLSAVEHEAQVEVMLNPAADFGKTPFQHLGRDHAGAWHGRCGSVAIHWYGGEAARPNPDGHHGRQLTQTIRLEPGQSHDLVLIISSDSALPAPPDAAQLWRATETAWAERVPRFASFGSATRDCRHSYAVLRGLTSDTGAMVAAATTSLPERASEGRNYDYRYGWIRDQSYAGQAAAAVGAPELLDSAVSYVSSRLHADGADLNPAYTVTGNRVPPEQRLELDGYPGGDDVVGNWVRKQFQLDAFGETLLLFSAAADLDRLDTTSWQAAEIAASVIADRWQEADAGIWELEPARWTHSGLICAAGLRQISRHSPSSKQAARWAGLADQIVTATAEFGVHRSGRWQRTSDDDRVDSALLLSAIRGAVPFDDPRSVATLDAVLAELTEDGYAYRYRQDERDLGAAEGAFLICGFWIALALEQRGDQLGALRWFERTRSACGPPGLFSEEYDVAQRQMRGNLPQAFVHALLLETAGTLGAE